MQKIKQNKLAEELGISKSYLSMILSGQRKCPTKLAKRLSSLGIVNSNRINGLPSRVSRVRVPSPAPK